MKRRNAFLNRYARAYHDHVICLMDEYTGAHTNHIRVELQFYSDCHVNATYTSGPSKSFLLTTPSTGLTTHSTPPVRIQSRLLCLPRVTDVHTLDK